MLSLKMKRVHHQEVAVDHERMDTRVHLAFPLVFRCLVLVDMDMGIYSIILLWWTDIPYSHTCVR